MINFQMLLLKLLILLIGYLLGSFPSGYIAGKLFIGKDIRTIGSGSTGATNVLRHVGKKAAILVFLIDVSKGMLSVLIAKYFLLNDSWQVAIGLTSLAGHIWPIWLNWQGGKAVATGLGLFLGLSWQVGIASLGIFILVITIFRTVSLASLIAAISLPLLMQLHLRNSSFYEPYFVISLISMLLVLWRHRSNLKRLINGTEPKIGKSKTN